LRFFYVQVLKRGWSVAETPYPKKVLHLPEILSQLDDLRAHRMCFGGLHLIINSFWNSTSLCAL
jgi:hypothetical protein